MQIKLNGENREIKTSATVADLAEEMGIGAGGAAVGVNNRLIKRPDWPTTHLNENDDVIIIKAAYGG